MNSSKREFTPSVDSLRNFLKTFDHASKCIYIFPQRSPKLRLDLQSQNSISLLNTITISLNIQKDKFVYRSYLATTILAHLPSKNLNYTAIIFFLQILSTTLTIVKFTISTRTDYTLQTTATKLGVITMCRAFSPVCRYDNNTIIFFEVVFCPNTKCSDKFCVHKKTFQSLGRRDYECPQSLSVCQVRNFPFEDRTNSFYVVWPSRLRF